MQEDKIEIIENGGMRDNLPSSCTVHYGVTTTPYNLSGKALYEDYLVVKKTTVKLYEKVKLYGKRLIKTIRENGE